MRNANGAGTPNVMASWRQAHSGVELVASVIAAAHSTARAVVSTVAVAANRSPRASDRNRRGSIGGDGVMVEVNSDQRAVVTARIELNERALGNAPNGRPDAKAPSPSVHACSVECDGVWSVCSCQAASRRLLLQRTCAAHSDEITARP